MKKITILLLISMALVASDLQAQDAKARQILDAVKQKYKTIDAFRAYFTYTMSSPTTGVNETVDGNIVVKEEKFHLKLPEQEIMTDGSTQWTYLKTDNEVNITDYEPDEDEITPNKIYDIYEQNYKYSYVEEKHENGKIYEIIDLKPKDKEAQYFKIRLRVVKDSNSIKSWEIFERNANRYLYTVTKFATVKVGDGYFKYNPSKYPNNPEVVDLR